MIIRESTAQFLYQLNVWNHIRPEEWTFSASDTEGKPLPLENGVEFALPYDLLECARVSG